MPMTESAPKTCASLSMRLKSFTVGSPRIFVSVIVLTPPSLRAFITGSTRGSIGSAVRIKRLFSPEARYSSHICFMQPVPKTMRCGCFNSIGFIVLRFYGYVRSLRFYGYAVVGFWLIAGIADIAGIEAIETILAIKAVGAIAAIEAYPLKAQNLQSPG